MKPYEDHRTASQSARVDKPLKTATQAEAPGLVQNRDVLAADIDILVARTDREKKRIYRKK